ncbi:ABC transporter permease, partial [Mesorhizobium sp. M7A.F.Ca.US.007.01.1.1]
MISFQRRSGSSLGWNVVCYSAAISGALLASAVLLRLSGGDPARAFTA